MVEIECEMLALIVRVPEYDMLLDGDWETVGLSEMEGESVRETVPDIDFVSETEGLIEALIVAERDRESEGVQLVVADLECVTLRLDEMLALSVREMELDGEEESVRETVPDELNDGVEVRVTVPLLDGETDSDSETLPEGVAEWVADNERVAVWLLDTDTVCDSVFVCEPDCDPVVVEVRVALCDEDPDFDSDALPDSLIDRVAVRVNDAEFDLVIDSEVDGEAELVCDALVVSVRLELSVSESEVELEAEAEGDSVKLVLDEKEAVCDSECDCENEIV